MNVDLIHRVLYLNSKGDSKHLERFNTWIKEIQSDQAIEFIVESEKYYWLSVSSVEFDDIIHEDSTDCLLIYSEKRDFLALGKRHDRSENLIGEKTAPYITTLWILRSNIESVKVSDTPICVWTPHLFNSPLSRINYDFQQLILKLNDTQIKLTQLVEYHTSKTSEIRIR